MSNRLKRVVSLEPGGSIVALPVRPLPRVIRSGAHNGV